MRREVAGSDLDEAVTILESGGLVAVPTETVYGLAAIISNPVAVRRVFDVKGRPHGHPLIVHVADSEQARALSHDWPESAERLTTEFWPGPVTVIVKRSSAVSDEVTGGRDSVAIRCPSHPLFHELLERLSAPLAAPSANRFGRVSPTSARHVIDDLGDDVDYVLDGGPCTIGLESTIVDCTTSPVQVLRPGAISEDDIRRVVGDVAPVSGSSRASGMLESHYAPICRVVAVETIDQAKPFIGQPRTRLIDAASDPERAARNLYADLRGCDVDGIDTAVIVLPAPVGIGIALRDRIGKAAAR